MSYYIKDNIELFKECNIDKNKSIDLDSLTSGSNLKIWWKCEKGHEYEAQVYNRTNGRGCPYCSNKRILIGYNDLFTTSPFLEKIWDFEKNSIDPHTVNSGSSKKVYWKCPNGHNWIQEIRVVNNGTRCPYCNRHTPINGENDFATLYPNLLSEWDYNKNTILPNSILPGSEKIVWWICSKGHHYKCRINSRTLRNSGCPYCSNKKIIVGYNDLFSIKPKLKEFWNYEKNMALGIIPEKYTYGSNKKVWWKCKYNHEWKASISHVSSLSTFCPICSKGLQTSIPELAVYFYIKKYFKDAINSYKGTELNKYEIDVYIPSLKLGIEYDGDMWHKNINNDLKKDNIIKKKGIFLIRLRENCDFYSGYSYIIDVHKNKKNNLQYLENPIIELFDLINNKYNLNIKYDINLERDYIKILSYKTTYYNRDKSNTIDKYNKDLLKEWDYEKNESINPLLYTVGSSIKVWWKCNKGHSYQMSINKKAIRNYKCPVCSNRQVLKGYNDFESCFPKLLIEWNYKRNTTHPDNIYYGSHKRVEWICSKCGHCWKTTLYHRTIRNQGCPKCYKNCK